MSIRFRILEVVPKGSSEYEYSLLSEDGRAYSMLLDRRQHISIIETEGEVVGRYIEYDAGRNWFWFLDE